MTLYCVGVCFTICWMLGDSVLCWCLFYHISDAGDSVLCWCLFYHMLDAG